MLGLLNSRPLRGWASLAPRPPEIYWLMLLTRCSAHQPVIRGKPAYVRHIQRPHARHAPLTAAVMPRQKQVNGAER